MLSKFLRKSFGYWRDGNVNDFQEMSEWLKTLNVKQANKLASEIQLTLPKAQAQELCRIIFTHLRESVAMEIITDGLKTCADMGFGTLANNKDGQIDGIHIDSEQGERLLDWLNADTKKGGAA